MFLQAGALSLALLLASRLLGLVRESALAAAFGASGLADVAVLMLTFPDWLAGVLASGALAYVLLPAWARQSPPEVGRSQRRVALGLLLAGGLLGLVVVLGRATVAGWLAGGLGPQLWPQAAYGLAWSGLALPAALLAALWSTRLQHERDFVGMYGANLAVNVVLIAVISAAAMTGVHLAPVAWLGCGLLAAMGLRLLWLGWRQRRFTGGVVPAPAAALPAPPLWLWAILVAGLPLALPFAARSVASQAGEGALAAFNYAWKLVELPQLLAIQLVATLAFPAIARAFASPATHAEAAQAVRSAFSLAWALACAAAAGLVVGAPAVAQLLFGWGRMDPAALARVAEWGAVGAWGLLPQAVLAVGLTVLASEQRLRPAVAAHAAGLAVLLGAAAAGLRDGAQLMLLMNLVFAAMALGVVAALGPQARAWLPWREFAVPLAVLLAAFAVSRGLLPGTLHAAAGLAAAVVCACAVMAAAWVAGPQFRRALRR